MEHNTLDPALRQSSVRFSAWLREKQSAFAIKGLTSPVRQLTLLKPFSEYVLCNELLLSLGLEGRFLENLDWAWDQVECGDVITRLLLARPDSFCVASVYAPFHRLGFHNSRLESVLKAVSELRGTQSVGMPAWLRLGFQHAMAQVMGTQYRPESAGATWLLAKSEPWFINDDILYSITHEVFYASDFGRSLCQLHSDVLRYLEIWIPIWTRCYIEHGNWDITGELIMVAECLPEFSWDRNDPMPALLEQQAESGEVQGLPGAGSSLLDGTETQEQAAFYNCYHTTLVAAMAVSMRQRKLLKH